MEKALTSLRGARGADLLLVRTRQPGTRSAGTLGPLHFHGVFHSNRPRVSLTLAACPFCVTMWFLAAKVSALVDLGIPASEVPANGSRRACC